MPVSKAPMTSKSPSDWREGAGKARTARDVVAAQLTELIEESDMTGSGDLVIQRVRELGMAQREGDRGTIRAASMELALSAALYAVGIDLTSRAIPRSNS